MLKFLVHLWTMLLIPMFAAAAPVIAGGSGEGAGGGEGGGEGAGEGSGEGAGEGAGGEGGEGESGEPGAGEGEGLDDLEGRDRARDDGRKLSPELKKYFDELQGTNPKLAKQLRGAFFAVGEFRAQFPTPQAAAKAKELIEQVGGEEGLQAIEQERSAWNALDAQYDKGDPQFIKSIAEENPNAFVKLMPTALEEFATRDRDTYNHVMARVLHNTLDKSGVLGYLTQLRSVTDVKDAQRLADELLEWAGGIRELASKQPEKKVDPEREKLQTEREKFEQEKRVHFERDIATDFRTHLKTGIESELGKLLAARRIDIKKLARTDPDAYNLLLSNCDRAISIALAKQPDIKQKAAALLATGDKARVLKFYRSRTDRVLAQAVKGVYNAFYKLGGGKQVETTRREEANQQRRDPGTGGSGAGTKLGKAPESNQIDYSRTTNDMIWKNEAYLKGKKEKVSW